MIECPLCFTPLSERLTGPNGRVFFDCSECRLVSLDPALRLSPDEEVARYKLHHNDVLDSSYRTFLMQAIEPLMKKVPQRAHGLDFGCGPSPASPTLLGEYGHTVCCYDPFFFPNGYDRGGEYDFILCTEAVEHFFYPAKEFEEISRLLRSGGTLAVMTRLFTSDVHFESWWYGRDPTHVSLYREQTFEWITRKLGWKLDSPSPTVRLLQKVS